MKNTKLAKDKDFKAKWIQDWRKIMDALGVMGHRQGFTEGP